MDIKDYNNLLFVVMQHAVMKVLQIFRGEVSWFAPFPAPGHAAGAVLSPAGEASRAAGQAAALLLHHRHHQGHGDPSGAATGPLHIYRKH